MKIETNLLRYFVLIYGKLTLRLNPYSSKSLFINIALICWFYYYIYQTNRDHSKPIPNQLKVDEAIQKKPLYSMVTNITSFLYPTIYFFNMVYFIFKGPFIVELLVSSSFNNVMNFRINTKKIMFTIIVLDLCQSLFLGYKKFEKFSQLLEIKFYKRFFARAIIFLNPIIVFRLVQYYKIATHRSLLKIENNLLHQNLKLSGKLRF